MDLMNTVFRSPARDTENRRLSRSECPVPGLLITVSLNPSAWIDTGTYRGRSQLTSVCYYIDLISIQVRHDAVDNNHIDGIWLDTGGLNLSTLSDRRILDQISRLRY